MKPRYERQAWQLQARITELEKELAASEDGVRHAEAMLGGTPALRDRNRFFHWLLNSELLVYERVAPLWRERRRCARTARRAKARLAAEEARITAAVRRGVVDEREYRALEAELAREEQARSACKRMLDSIGEARRQIGNVLGLRPHDEASRSAADQAVRELSDRLRLVRNHAAGVSAKIAPRRSFDLGDLAALDVDLSGVEGKKLKNVRTRLDATEKTVRSLLADIRTRKGAVERRQLEYAKKARARFRADPPP